MYGARAPLRTDRHLLLGMDGKSYPEARVWELYSRCPLSREPSWKISESSHCCIPNGLGSFLWTSQTKIPCMSLMQQQKVLSTQPSLFRDLPGELEANGGGWEGGKKIRHTFGCCQRDPGGLCSYPRERASWPQCPEKRLVGVFRLQTGDVREARTEEAYS